MKKLIFVETILLILVLNKLSMAQESNKSWNKVLNLNAGIHIGTQNWTYSHPLYGGSGMSVIKETGSFKGSSIFYGGIELSKKYVGANLNAGLFSSEIDIDKSGEKYSFNSILTEITGQFYFLGNPISKYTPYLNIGYGGILTNGDYNKSGLYLLFGCGFRTFFLDKFGVTVSIIGHHITFDEFPAADGLTGDIKVTPFIVNVGLVHKL